MKKLLILIAPTIIHERFTGDVIDWIILKYEDQAIQKIDFTNINMEQSTPNCQTLKPMHSQTCKRVNIMTKIWLSMLTCSTFKAFVKALKI